MDHTKYEEIDEILGELKADPQVCRMKNYIQHGHISTFDHCEKVAILSYYLNRKLHLHGDARAILRGAMLHDFYLYDWHHKDGGSHRLHGYHHADKALANACRCFDIDQKEQHIIWCHMWPLNITRLPRCREAWIVCLADKYVSLQETLFRR